MSNEQKTVLVRCKCGKKFRVRTNADDAGVSCPECGQMVRLTAALPAVVTSEKHWSWNVLWMVWAVPACIAVLGAVIIIGDLMRQPDNEGQNQTQQQNGPEPVADAGGDVVEEPDPVEAEPPPNEFKTLFPGPEMTQLPDLEFRGIRNSNGFRMTVTSVIGEMEIVDGALVTEDRETTAMVLQESIEDFELELVGDFRDRGDLFFLMGWDHESSSGVLLYTMGLVNAWPWIVTRIEDAVEVGEYEKSGKHFRIRSEGTLKVKVQDKKIWLTFSDVKIAEGLDLPDYGPGALILGTAPNQYQGKAIRIDTIRLRGAQ